MPRFDTYQTQTDIGIAAASGRRATASDFGGDVGLTDLGQGLDTTGRVIQRNQEELKRQQEQKRNQDSALWVSKSMADLRAQSTTAYLEAQKTAPADGSGFTEAQLQGFDKSIEQMVATAPTPEAAQEFQIRAQDARTSLLQDSAVYEASLHGQAAKDGYNHTVSTLAATVRASPSQLDGALKDLAVGADALTIPESAKAALKQQGTETITTAAVYAMIDANPTQTRDSLVNGKFAGLLPADKVEGLIGNAETEIRRREAENRQRQAEAEAAARQMSRYKIEDEMAAVGDGKTTGLVNDADYKLVYGDQWQLAKASVDKTRETAIAAQGLALTPPSQWQSTIDSAAPAAAGADYKGEASRHTALVDAATNLQSELAKDPASYVLNHSPAVKDAFDAAAKDPSQLKAAVDITLQTQERMEVPEEKRLPLPTSVAKDIVDRLAGTQPENAVKEIQSYSQAFGANWPKVVAQLSSNGLPSTLKVLTVLDAPGDAPAANALVQATRMKDAELKSLVPADSAKSIDQELDTLLAPMASTLPPENYADIRDAASRMALYGASTGVDPVTAANNAASAFTSKYTFNNSYRVPRQWDGGAVDRGLQMMVRSLQPIDLRAMESADPALSAEYRQQQQLYLLVGQPTFRTNETETGVYLLYPNGVPAQRADGSLIQFKFDDAAALKVEPTRPTSGPGLRLPLLPGAQ